MAKKIDYSKALGSSITIPLGKRGGGPIDWMGLRSVVRERLVSSGGRPTDPRWDTKRLVPFQKETWERLRREAAKLSEKGPKISPAQLAARIIEERLR